MEIVERMNDSELAIYYKNGSIQRFVGCDDIDKHRGINCIDVVFDEFSEMNEQIWTAIIQPVLRENKGTATFIFTPKGKNHSWKLLQQAKDDTDNWFVTVKPITDTLSLSKEEIEEARNNTPEDLFNQEYMCEFLDGAGAFFRRIRDNLHCETPKADNARRYQMGVDLAKYQDYTVLTIIDLNTFHVVEQERFNQIDYSMQKAKIEAMYLRYFKPLIWIDSTGVGEPIYDDLCTRGLRIEPFHFTEQSRKDLLNNLQLLLEQNKIKIPEREESLIAELQSVQYALTKNGRTKVQVPDGLHDDCVMSLALACWQLPQNPLPKPGSLKLLNTQEVIKNTSYE